MMCGGWKGAARSIPCLSAGSAGWCTARLFVVRTATAVPEGSYCHGCSHQGFTAHMQFLPPVLLCLAPHLGKPLSSTASYLRWKPEPSASSGSPPHVHDVHPSLPPSHSHFEHSWTWPTLMTSRVASRSPSTSGRTSTSQMSSCPKRSTTARMGCSRFGGQCRSGSQAW